MKHIPLYQVDAFAAGPFAGNPAAICPLENDWLDDELMQQIAMENNLAETAFFIPQSDTGEYQLRWFTPTTEVDLCGHATLASAHIIFNHLGFDGNSIKFHTHSGLLTVDKLDKGYQLDFPSDKPFPTTLKKTEASALFNGLDVEPTQVYRGNADLMVVLESEDEVRALSPEFRMLQDLDTRGIIVTAPGDVVDFVSRFFAPQSGIDEDSVTGSAHTTMVPYWAERLGKDELQAQQLSVRGGEISCTLEEDRVKLRGDAFTVLEGKFFLYW